MNKFLRAGLGGLAAIGCCVVAAPAYAVVDDTGPTIDTSAIRASYTRGEAVAAVFTCSDPDGVAACDGPATIDTSTAGDHTLAFSARDNAGNASTATVRYTVTDPPVVLDLTLGAPTQFAPFLLGADGDYTATLVATATSTASTAVLTVVDPAANQPGHLVNGPYALPSPLGVRASSAGGSSPGAGTVSGTPVTLINYAGAVANDAVNVTLTQHIGAADLLRTGEYAKTLTFTLAAITP